MISQNGNSNELAAQRSFYIKELEDLENRVVSLEQWENSISGVFNSLGKIDTDTIKTVDMNASNIISTMINTQSLITGSLQATDMKPAFKLVHSNITYNPGSYYTLAYSVKPVNPGIVFVKIMGGNNDDYSLAIVQYTESSTVVLFSDNPDLLLSFQVHNVGDYLYLTVAGNPSIANKQVMCSYINSEWVDIGVLPAVLGSDSIVLTSVTETLGLHGFGVSNLLVDAITADTIDITSLTADTIKATSIDTDTITANTGAIQDLSSNRITGTDANITNIISDSVDSLAVRTDNLNSANSILDNVNINTGTISNAPVNAIDIANKEYVDSSILVETNRAVSVETDLFNKINTDVGAETARATAREDALDAAKVDKDVSGVKRELINDMLQATDSTTVALILRKGNVDNNSQNDVAIPLRLVSETVAGIMPKETYAQVLNNTERISSLELGERVYLVDLTTETPTQQELMDTYHTVSGTTTDPLDQTMLVDRTYNRSYTWFRSSGTWESLALGQVNQFTNQSFGLIKGEDSDGKLFAEADGTGSVVGWDTLKSRVSNNESDNINSGVTLRKTDAAASTRLDLLNRTGASLSNVTLNSASATNAGLLNNAFYNQLKAFAGSYREDNTTSIPPGADLNNYYNKVNIIENYFCQSGATADSLLNKPLVLNQSFILTCMCSQGTNFSGTGILRFKQIINPCTFSSINNQSPANRIWQRNGTRENNVWSWEPWKILTENSSYNLISYRANPENFAFNSSSTTNTRIKIILPVSYVEQTMLSFKIRFSNNYITYNEILIGGYLRSSGGTNNWYNATANQIVGSSNITCYFGRETDSAYVNKAYVTLEIPNTILQYCEVSIIDAVFYYSSRNDYIYNDWVIRFDTNIPNLAYTIATTPNVKMDDYPIINKGELPAGAANTSAYWNNLPAGMYARNSTSSPSGFPISGTGMVLHIKRGSGLNGYLLYFNNSSSITAAQLYYTYYTSSTFSTWKPVMDGDNFYNYKASTLAEPGNVVIRDANTGRSQIAAPSVAADIANKGYVDAHINATAVHSSTVSATANRIILRDANGRAQVAAPNADNDIVNKSYLNTYFKNRYFQFVTLECTNTATGAFGNYSICFNVFTATTMILNTYPRIIGHLWDSYKSAAGGIINIPVSGSGILGTSVNTGSIFIPTFIRPRNASALQIYGTILGTTQKVLIDLVTPTSVSCQVLIVAY